MNGSSASREKVQLLISSAASFVLSLVLFAYSNRNPWTFSVGISISNALLSPLQVTHRYFYNIITGAWSSYIALQGVEEENEKMKERITLLGQRHAQFEEALSENTSLRSLLELKKVVPARSSGASVIAYDPSPWENVVLIDKGSEQNIESGSPVFVEGGLVGQVVSVGYGASRVRLITDRNARHDVLIQGSRTRGVIQGDGQGTSLLYIQKEEEVKIGDVIVTSGLDGMFPKGVLVGTVTDVLLEKGAIFQSIQVSPSVDVEKLEFVLVSTPGAQPSKGLSASK